MLDYTYPAIEYGGTKVQVDLPFDQSKQASYLSALQKYWSRGELDFFQRRSDDDLPIIRAPIFHQARSLPGNVPGVPLGGIPEGCESVSKYKIFVIVITVSEHAYNGSFSIELRPCAAPNVVINKVSFLRRGSPENCAACVGRQASHSLVRSSMVLKSSDIQSLISGAGLDRPDATDAEIINLLKNSFEARVVGCDGKLIAQSRQGLSQEPNCTLLQDVGKPKMAFYSASCAYPVGNLGGNIQFYNWTKHTSLLANDWVDRR